LKFTEELVEFVREFFVTMIMVAVFIMNVVFVVGHWGEASGFGSRR
jgi:hypothetical protein